MRAITQAMFLSRGKQNEKATDYHNNMERYAAKRVKLPVNFLRRRHTKTETNLPGIDEYVNGFDKSNHLNSRS